MFMTRGTAGVTRPDCVAWQLVAKIIVPRQAGGRPTLGSRPPSSGRPVAKDAVGGQVGQPTPWRGRWCSGIYGVPPPRRSGPAGSQGTGCAVPGE